MTKELLNLYEQKQKEIKSRLNDFKSLKEEQQFQEFLFCLLTPQSNAQRCWQAVEEISSLTKLTKQNITRILSTKTRFHHTKTKRILEAQHSWRLIKEKLDLPPKELRKFLAENIKGLGLKEASHFIRNIGLSNNEIAILDRHILKNLYALSLIPEQKIKSQKNYLEIEQKFLNLAHQLKIPSDELDLLFWSKENGEIFK